jgi:hypothetical protein
VEQEMGRQQSYKWVPELGENLNLSKDSELKS